ncbi:MAG TPA: DUF429 domain-containing protein [Thermoanaerobaculia bacterium]
MRSIERSEKSTTFSALIRSCGNACEVHPEVSFAAWNRAPLQHYKKAPDGKCERLALIQAHFGENAFDIVRLRYRKGVASDDDIADAFAALWTAERIATGRAQTLPAEPPVDSAGLRMEIVY